MFVDPRRRTGIDRPAIHHLAPFEHREAVCKSKYEGQMLLDYQHCGAAIAPRCGKHFGEPIHRLLGGCQHDKIKAYASILFGRDGRETAEIGRRWIEAGYHAVKFGWEPMGQSEAVDIDLVRGAREGSVPGWNDPTWDAIRASGRRSSNTSS